MFSPIPIIARENVSPAQYIFDENTGNFFVVPIDVIRPFDRESSGVSVIRTTTVASDTISESKNCRLAGICSGLS